ncbi:putative transcription factor PosF21 [Acorus calamus]|uniref:Transcription factor PosF21 n=1 Tax=Acorus calamus TaxID=4465 RepID=A0AAV9DF88_ACOCL|nr:putative transcription factor PosF21 [Acorus calamus]
MEPPNNNNNARFGRFGAAAAADPMISSSSAAASGPPPPAPPHRGSHRRAQSETFLRLPDDLLFDVDADFGVDDIDFPSLSDDAAAAACGGGGNTMSVDSFRSNGGGGGEREAKRQAAGMGHFRSLSVDAAFFEDLDLGGGGGGAGGGGPTTVGEKRFHHRRTSSMDGSSSSEFETSVAGVDFTKKAMAADKLAELALIDPKRAKRILANRQSAARSKERKIRYTSELERKVQTLQTEATTLSAQLTLLQRDTNGLTVENKELKLRLQAMEQQAHLCDGPYWRTKLTQKAFDSTALNEALREEVQRLKIATGQIQSMANNSFNRGPPQQSMYHHPQTMHHIGIHPSQQLSMSQSSSSNGQSFSSPSPQDSVDFM